MAMRRWRAPAITLENTQTGDGRVFAPMAVQWADLPLPLAWLRDGDQHVSLTEVAPQIGVIEGLSREGDSIPATGAIDDENADGAEVIRRMEAGTAPLGNRFPVSIDPDNWEVQIVATEGDDEEIILLAAAGQGPLTASSVRATVVSALRAAAGDPDPGEEGGDDGVVLFEDTVDAIIERYTRVRIRGACYDEQTEILTEERGWQSFADLAPVDRVATRNPKTDAIEWQSPTGYTTDPWDGPMIHFEGGGTQSPNGQRANCTLDLLVTPNHRMLVRRTGSGEQIIMRADELAKRSNRSYVFVQGAHWEAEDVEHFYVSPPSDSGKHRNPDPVEFTGDHFAAFMGAYLSEGSRTDSGRILIAQRPTSKGFELFESLFNEMLPGAWRREGGCFAFNNKRLTAYLHQFGRAPQKYVPNELKAFSARQLRIFFDYYMAGDGSADGRRAYTASRQLADDLQEIAAKLGMWAVVTERPYRESQIDGRTIRPTCPHYLVAFKDRPGKRGGAVWDWTATTVHHEGTVRCVTVPNEVLYVRRNGIPAWCGNTLCSVAAFDGAFIELEAVTAEGEAPPAEPAPEAVVVTAAAVPARPPAAWFSMSEPEPGDDRLIEQVDGGWAVPLTITDDGQVFGHIARRDQSHRGYVGRHVPPPTSATGYREFHVGQVVCDDDTRVATGALVVGCDHAPPAMALLEARDHYAHSGMGWADGRVSDGQFGPWFAGALRPGLGEEDLRVLRALAPSGDWRPNNGTLEMCAVLSVNVPGFPIAREAMAASSLRQPAPALDAPRVGLAASGEVASLVAAGMVVRCGECAERERQRAALTASLGSMDEVLSLLASLRGDFARIERRTRHLEPVAASALAERVHAGAVGLTQNGR